jgi:hypothetical protein
LKEVNHSVDFKIAYFYAPAAIFILPVELIHGLVFALTWAGGKRNAP